MLKLRSGLQVLACAAALVAAAPQSRAAPLDPPVTVKVGFVAALFDCFTIIAVDRGYFHQEGIEVELKQFPASLDANQALSIGAIDALASAVSVQLLNSKIRKIDSSIVASAGSNLPGHGSIALVLRKDLIDSGRYKGPRDLKGMKLATAMTAPAQFLAAQAGADAGLGEGDIEFVALGIANIVAGMSNKAIEGGSVNEPFASLMVEKADGVRVLSMDQKYPNFPAGYLMYGPLLTKTNVAAGNRFMVAYLKGLRDYRLAFGPEKKDQDAILALLKKNDIVVTPETPSLGIPEDGAPSFDHVDAYLDWLVQTGTLRGERPDPKSLWDDRFRQAALAALKDAP
jgi:NitT/TauT family transport system substrate-binding protein